MTTTILTFTEDQLTAQNVNRLRQQAARLGVNSSNAANPTASENLAKAAEGLRVKAKQIEAEIERRRTNYLAMSGAR